MPFTHLHFGPSACISLPLKRYIDVPTFLLANVVVDVEVLVVIYTKYYETSGSLHPFIHTFLIGSAVAVLWAIIAFFCKGIFRRTMNFLRVEYKTSFLKILISSLLGVWFHILVDSFCHRDITPFYPAKINPFKGALTSTQVYSICLLSFLPAIIIYAVLVVKYNRRNSKE